MLLGTSSLGSRHHLFILQLVSLGFLHGFGGEVPERSANQRRRQLEKCTQTYFRWRVLACVCVYSRWPVLQDQRCGGKRLKLKVLPPACRQGAMRRRRCT